MRQAVWLALVVLTSSALAEPTSPPVPSPAPCSHPEYRQFDFWVGDWDVYTPTGRKAGRNTITVEYGGCVLHERYQTPGTYRGESLNTYDPVRRRWHQTWVDNAGTLLQLDGIWDGAVMELSGTLPNKDGSVTHQRIRWSRNRDGSVRQLWEQSADEESWQAVFDGEYHRREKSED